MSNQDVALRQVETHVQIPTMLEKPDSIIAIIAAAARDPQVDVSKMQALLDLKQRVDQQNAEIAFNQALTRLQPRLPRVRKNGEIDLGRGGKPLKFARYEDIDAAIRPLLTAEGFSLSFSSEPCASGVLMTCTLSHVMGHSKRSTMQLPADQGPGRNSLQAIGSSHSYGKRYLVCDMLNIVCDGADDDGNAAVALTDEQYEKLATMFDALATGEDKARFLKYMNVGTVEAIRASDYQKAVSALAAKLRQAQGGK